ncbi:MAG: hypothetical protein M3014_04520 [Chloroflexota bacterium]|nr:hypothetical protein [Chloroflexota bacterium]
MQEPPTESAHRERAYAVSIVEEIDPEPLPARDFTRVREVVLGLVLIAGVLGWAGWQSWHSEWRRNSYEAGQKAANSKQWEEARALFGDASGYHDADARTAEAMSYIKRRDLAYSKAAQETTGKQWLQAMQSLQVVEAIEPGYSDAAKLLSQDRENAETEGLDGAILMRARANPQGLYLRKGNDWLWLKGSDLSSVVHDRGAGGCVLYDVPSAGTSPNRRRYTAAFLSGVNVNYMSPNMLTVPAGQVIGATSYHCGKHGIWEFALDAASLNQRYGVRQFVPTRGVAYYPYGTGKVIDPFTGTNNWPILDISPDGEQILFAQVENNGAADMSSNLYLAGGPGGKRLVYTQQGGFFGAQISPDGNYVVLLTYTPADTSASTGQTQTQRVVLIDLLGRAAPRVLTEWTGTVLGAHDQTAVGATFLADGPYAGKALVAEWDRHRSSYSIIDPQEPQDASIKISIASDAQPDNRVFTTGKTGDKELLLLWQSGNSIQVAQLDRIKSVATGALPIIPTEYLWDYKPVERDGKLLYATWQNNTRGLYSKDALAIMSIPLSDLFSTEASPRPLYSASVGYAIAGLPSVTPAYTGSGAMAYIDLKSLELHLKSYSSSIDLSVEDGITAIYPPYNYSNQHRLLKGSDFGEYIQP